MGVNFAIYVVDRDKFNLKLKGLVGPVSSIFDHPPSTGSEDFIWKVLFCDRAYWIELLKNTSRKKLFRGYSISVKRLLGRSPSDSVFDFQWGSYANNFLRDQYGGTIGILNSESSSQFINYLKKLLSEGFVYIEARDYSGDDFLSNRPFFNEYDEDQEGKRFIREVTHNEDARPFLEEIIRDFEEFQSSEKCLIGIYS